MSLYKQAKAYHLRLGRRGEALAASYLRSMRIEVLLRNYRNRRGEIDIIARDGDVLCFVEVKTRRNGSKFRPAAGLSEVQKTRISQAAMLYLHEIGNPEVVYRFDLVEIILSRWDICELRYWRRHFSRRQPN